MVGLDNESEFGSNMMPQDDDDGWLLTYSDMMTLLFCFFVLLASISKLDMVKVEQMTQFSDTNRMTMKILAEKVEQAVQSESLGGTIKSELTSRGVEISFKDKLLFDLGSADLKQVASPVLTKIAHLLNHKEIAERRISVEGHTDSLPIKTDKFPSNWELSSSRASSVVRFFIDEGLAKERLGSTGYADTQPKVTGTSKELGISENRRVVVVISPESYTSKSERVSLEMSNPDSLIPTQPIMDQALKKIDTPQK